jgi:hypothetical protein
MDNILVLDVSPFLKDDTQNKELKEIHTML